ncbi:MAG: trypsin-like serine protease [Deltaproteobacteria bacterium]|nr:trypsin-like serine protease [Deltaproteobacteria bacterium]
MGGTADPSAAHLAVVWVQVATPRGSFGCTGTLIAPLTVLTAGHCTWDSDEPIDAPSKYSVAFGNDLYGSYFLSSVTAVHRHPDYRSQAGGDSNDIAILIIKKQPAEVVPIPALPSDLGLTDADRGGALEFVGYGRSVANDPDSIGVRMHVDGSISDLCEGDGCQGTQQPWVLCYGQATGGPCGADSGGPALIERNGAVFVAAVTSYGDPGCSLLGCSTRTDHYWSDFIAQYAGYAIGTACVAGAECRTGNCVGGVCCDQSCAGACQACSVAAGASQDGHCLALDGTSCDDGNACRIGDVCHSGTCSGSPKACEEAGPCRAAGSCDPSTGGCVPGAPVVDGTTCDDSNPCTLGDACLAGGCTAGPTLISCPAPDACHEDSTCQPSTGLCAPFPSKPDDTACPSGSCRAGVCTPSSGCSAAGSGPAYGIVGLLALLALRRPRR